MEYSKQTLLKASELFPSDSKLFDLIKNNSQEAFHVVRSHPDCCTDIGLSFILNCIDREDEEKLKWGVKTLRHKAIRQRDILDLLFQMEEEMNINE